jgi:predicted ATPase/class 3 adenylate cyclase
VAGFPTGTVTFLFTDIEGSTRLWEHDRGAMSEALARHDELLREVIDRRDGTVFATGGDGLAAAFARAADAAAAAIDAQRSFSGEHWPEATPIRVRMGVHTGEAEERDGDYFGPQVNKAARLMAVAHGGQVVCSQVTAELIRDGLDDGLNLVDLGEHRLRDLSRPERVFQVQASGFTRTFPQLVSLDAFPGNLPVQANAFVGRQDEVARVAASLAQLPVVTLTGVGGVGKTRLALQVAGEVVPGFRDGAWLIELAGVRDPDALESAVSATFGLEGQPGKSGRDALMGFLAPKEMLLVLDNCEHLLRAVAGLVGRVQQSCPEVRVLATSREGLSVRAEHIVAVASLAVPDDEGEVGAIGACDAVRLFVERAQAAKADFALTAANCAAVAQVCRQLDGVPLAIELAAARVPMMTPADLSRRLDQRFRVLTGGDRNAVERHQTLRASIDWSYDLCSPGEQTLLDRTSVFAGGAALDAIEAVCAGEGIERDDIFELLAGLVARCLVVADTAQDQTRYVLLETIRQYAAEHLDQRGDTDRVRTEHAQYYAGLVEELMPGTIGPDERRDAQRLAADLDNLRVALAFTITTNDHATGLRILDACSMGIVATEVRYRAVFAYGDAVARLPGASEDPRFPVALFAAGHLAYSDGDVETAARCLDRMQEAAVRLDLPPNAYAFVLLSALRSNVALARGDFATVFASYEVLTADDGPQRPWGRAWALSLRAHIRSFGPDAAEARVDADTALAIARPIGSPTITAIALSACGAVRADGEPDRALILLREALELDSRNDVVLELLGHLAARVAPRQDALAVFRRLLERFRWTGVSAPTALDGVACLLATRDPAAAATLFGAVDARGDLASSMQGLIDRRQRATEAIDASIGPDRRAECYEQGAALPVTQVTDEALDAVIRALDGA